LTTTLISCLDTKKSALRKWTISEYNIKLYREQGPSRAIYYFYNLDRATFPSNLFFKARKSHVSYQNLSSCEISFNQTKGDKYNFNICSFLPEALKTRLDQSSIKAIEVCFVDSIGKPVKSIFLDSLQKKTFIKNWNKKTPHAKGPLKIKYIINVLQSEMRSFKSDGYYINEQSRFGSSHFVNDKIYEFADKSFFNKLFDK